MSTNLYIIVFPTTRCDVGCLHCMDNVTKHGIDLPFSYAQLLVEKLTQEKLISDICITGHGEPLLYPNLKNLFELWLASPAINNLSLVTSGYNEEEQAKRSNLHNCLALAHFAKVTLVLSYNLYRNFDERWRAFLRDMTASPLGFFVIAKLCVSRENGKATAENFARLLLRVTEELGLPAPAYCGTDEDHNWNNSPKDLLSRKYKVHGRYADHKLLTTHHSIVKLGKAAKSTETPWYTEPCCSLKPTARNEVILYPDGYYYPCSRSIGCPRRRLGHIEHDSIKSIFKRKKRLLSLARLFFQPIEKIFGTTPCSICKLLPI